MQNVNIRTVENQGSGLSNDEQQELMLQYAPLVRRIARSLPIELPGVIDYEDAVGYGMCGLIEAARRYDPSRGNGFHAFASQRIRGAMLDAFRQMDRLSRTMRQRAREVSRAQNALQVALGRVPSEAETAAQMGIPLSEYRHAAEQGRWRTVSLDQLMDSQAGDDGLSLLDRVSVIEDVDVTGGMEHDELMGALANAVRLLPERERAIVALYYVEDLTMKEIARVLSVSETRVSQLHSQAVRRLRQQISATEAA